MPEFAWRAEELPQLCTSDVPDESRFIPEIQVPQIICGFQIFQGIDGVRNLSLATLLVSLLMKQRIFNESPSGSIEIDLY